FQLIDLILNLFIKYTIYFIIIIFPSPGSKEIEMYLFCVPVIVLRIKELYLFIPSYESYPGVIKKSFFLISFKYILSSFNTFSDLFTTYMYVVRPESNFSSKCPINKLLDDKELIIGFFELNN